MVDYSKGDIMGIDFKLEEQILNQKAKFYVKEIWGVDFNIPIKLNGRLKTTLGNTIITWVLGDKSKVTEINITKSLYTSLHDEHIVDDVLIHELCHWYCIENNLPSSDGDEYFENLLDELGCTSTREIRRSGNMYLIVCNSCSKVVALKSSYNSVKKCIDKYRSKCCKDSLGYGGTEFIPSKYKPTDKIKRLVKKYNESTLE